MKRIALFVGTLFFAIPSVRAQAPRVYVSGEVPMPQVSVAVTPPSPQNVVFDAMIPLHVELFGAGGLTLSDGENGAFRAWQGVAGGGATLGFPIGRVFEPHLTVSRFNRWSGTTAPDLTVTDLLGGVRLKLDPLASFYFDIDGGAALHSSDLSPGAILSFGAGYLFYTDCKSDMALDFGLQMQVGLTGNAEDNLLLARIGWQIPIKADAAIQSAQCRDRAARAAARAEEEATEAAAHAHDVALEQAPLPAPQVIAEEQSGFVATPLTPLAPVTAASVGAAPPNVSVASPAPETEAYSTPSNFRLNVEPFGGFGFGTTSNGMVGTAPSFSGGGGISFGIPLGLIVEPRFTFDGFRQNYSNANGSFGITELLGGVRLKLDPIVSLYLDLDAGYAFNSNTVSSGAVGKVGIGYLLYPSCGSDLAFDFGAEMHFGLGDNRPNDMLIFRVGIQLPFGPGQGRSGETGQCRRRADRQSREEVVEYNERVVAQANADREAAVETHLREQAPQPLAPTVAPQRADELAVAPVAAPTTVEVVAAPVAPAEPPRPSTFRWHLGAYGLGGIILGSDENHLVGPGDLLYGAGVALGFPVGAIFEPRFQMDVLSHSFDSTLSLQPLTLVTPSVGVRIKLDPMVNLHFDVNIGYGLNSGGIGDGPVLGAGVGYRWFFNCTSDSTFEVGVDGRYGLVGNAVDDAVLLRLGVDIAFGPSRSAESAQCHARAARAAEDAAFELQRAAYQQSVAPPAPSINVEPATDISQMMQTGVEVRLPTIGMTAERAPVFSFSPFFIDARGNAVINPSAIPSELRQFSRVEIYLHGGSAVVGGAASQLRAELTALGVRLSGVFVVIEEGTPLRADAFAR